MKERLRILTWNIHGARDAPVPAIAAEIAAHSPDVVCLNEVRRRHGARLGRELKLQAFVASSHIGPYGNVILTRLPVIAWRRHKFSGVHRIDRRDAAVITFEGDLTIVAVHLNLRSSDRLANIQELVAALPERSVIAGDVNEAPGEPVWQALEGRFDDACPSAPATFPATAPRARIDSIWIPKTAQSIRCDIAPSRLSDHCPAIAEIAIP